MKTPPNPWFLFAGEILTGVLTGSVFAYIGGQIGGALGASNNQSGFDDLIGVLSALLIAYPLGVTLGIYFFNRQFQGHGSLWLALLGSVGGVILVKLLAEPLNLNVNSTVLLVVLGIVPPLFAALVGRFGRKRRTT